MTSRLLYKCIHKILVVNNKKAIKAFIGLLLLCVFVFGCSKKAVEVQTEVPQAINDLITDMEVNQPACECHPFISQYIWRNQNVYVVAINDALNIGYVCDWIPLYYNSKGEKFTVEAGYFYTDFLNDSHLVKKIWSCE